MLPNVKTMCTSYTLMMTAFNVLRLDWIWIHFYVDY